MSEDRTPQNAEKYIVRFPDGMRDRLKAAAASHNRTLNAEIISRLEASFLMKEELPPKAAAIEILKMNKEQRMSFLETVEHSLLVEKGATPAHIRMLQSLREAALQEISTIEQQIKNQGG